MNLESIKLAWTNEGAAEILKNMLRRPRARGNGKSIMTTAVDGALCTAIAALERTRWISINDKLPEYDQKVLCCAKYEDKYCMFQNTYLGGGFWLSDTSKVTHWMPLPEEPTE